MTKIEYMQDLKVDVQVPTAGLQNLIKNPSGEQGAWGWETPVSNTVMIQVVNSGQPMLTFSTFASQAAYFRSEFLPMTASQYAVARYEIYAINASHNVKVRFEWYNSSKVLLSSSTQTAAQSTIGTNVVAATQAPANTAYMKVRFDLYNGVGNPSSNTGLTFYKVMVASSATSTGFGQTRTNLFHDPSGTHVGSWQEMYNQDTTSIAQVSSPAHSGTSSIRLHTTVSGFVMMRSAQEIAITAGSYYTTSAYIYTPQQTSRQAYVGMQWKVDGAWGPIYVGNGYTTTTPGVWTRHSYTMLAPTGATHLRLVASVNDGVYGDFYYFDSFLVEKTNVLGDYFDGGSTNTASLTHAWAGTAHASNSTQAIAATAFPYQEPFAWLPITGSVTSLQSDREAMNLGTLTVTLKDPSLDPARYNTILRPGKQVRVQGNDGGTWKNIFYGKISNAQVDYDKEKKAGSLVEGTITITAVDAMSDLANQGESRSVATIAELPYILEGKGVPWNCDGIKGHANTATIPVTNDNLSIADQIVLTRDSARGLAWVDKEGVLQVHPVPTSPTIDWVVADYDDDGSNHFPNGDFEAAGIGPWDSYSGATATRTSAAARTGTNGLRLTKLATGFPGMETWPYIEMPREGFYTLSYWVRSSVAGAIVAQYGDGLVNGFYETVLPVANTWYQIVQPYEIYDKAEGYVSVEIYGASYGTFPTGGTVDFDDFSLKTEYPTDAHYSEFDADFNTDGVMNQVELKHLTVSGDGNAEEVTMGTYENTTSVTTYGAKKATFTLVGTGINFANYASAILSANATPKTRPNSLRIPIKDTADLAFATGIDLCDYVYVFLEDTLADTFRVHTVSHSIDASGWFIDLTFDTAVSNPAPQYTPAPPVSEGVGTPAMLCHLNTPQVIGSGVWTTVSNWLYSYSHPDILWPGDGSFKVLKPGIYDIGFTAMFRNENNSSGVRGVAIFQNALQIAGQYGAPVAAQADYVSVGATTKFKLNANDVIWFKALQTTGGNVTIHGSPWTYCHITKVVGT